MTGDPLPGLGFRPLPDSPLPEGAGGCVVHLRPEYPGFHGHFPGEPVLPGMCHLDLAVEAAGRFLGRRIRPSRILRARFSRKVAPGEDLTIRITLEEPAGAPARVRTAHSVGEEPAAEILFEID